MKFHNNVNLHNNINLNYNLNGKELYQIIKEHFFIYIKELKNTNHNQ